MRDSETEIPSADPPLMKSGNTKFRNRLNIALLSLPFIGGCGVILGLQVQKAKNAALKTTDK